MSSLHVAVLGLLLIIFTYLFVVAFIARLVGGRWARILLAINGVVFWTTAWVLFTAYSYLLQATTLSKLVRNEIVGFGEPLLAPILKGVQMTSPYIMAGILVIFAMAGGLIAAHQIGLLLGILGLSLSPRSERDERVLPQLIQNIPFSVAWLIVGLLMVWVDASVFALRWAVDVAEVETEVQGAAHIADLIRWGYFLGFTVLAWIVERKFQQFLTAAGVQEVEEAPVQEPVPTPLPAPSGQRQVQEPVQDRRVLDGRFLSAPQDIPRRPDNNSPNGGTELSIAADGESVTFAEPSSESTEWEPAEGNFDPFGTRRVP